LASVASQPFGVPWAGSRLGGKTSKGTHPALVLLPVGYFGARVPGTRFLTVYRVALHSSKTRHLFPRGQRTRRDQVLHTERHAHIGRAQARSGARVHPRPAHRDRHNAVRSEHASAPAQLQSFLRPKGVRCGACFSVYPDLRSKYIKMFGISQEKPG